MSDARPALREPPPPDEVHIHYVRTDRVEPTLLARYQALLDDGERIRVARRVFEEGRREMLVTRALVRTVLSRYAPVEPTAWSFRENPHGRPEIAGPPGAPSLRFNLSNTAGLVVCAVSARREVGVDCEDALRHSRTLDIADRFFAPSEVEALRALPSAEQHDRFFDYWTLKESYIKARGMGLAIPLGSFAFSFAPDGVVSIAIDPSQNDDPASWQFERFRLSPRHPVAVAVRREAGRPASVVLHECLPLADVDPGAGDAGLR